MKTLQTFNYKKGDVEANFSFDINKPNHQKDIENYIEILDEAKKEAVEYTEKLINN